MPTIHLIGRPPFAGELQRFCDRSGWRLSSSADFPQTAGLQADDRFILCSNGDMQALRQLERLAAIAGTWNREHGEEVKFHVQLVLQTAVALQAVRLADFCPEVNRWLDVDLFSLPEMWAQRVLCALPHPETDHEAIGEETDSYPPLDRQPIGPDSPTTVHFVVSGSGETAQALVRMAALVCHYPNYVRNPRLRTRITWLAPDIESVGSLFRHRHNELFSRSHWRSISLAKVQPTVSFEHRPEGCPTEEDEFVDVEWEFVSGTPTHPAFRNKLALWAEDACQQLTVALTGDSDAGNAELAMGLPEALATARCTVLVEQRDDILVSTLRHAPQWSHLHAFGMERSAYNPLLPRHRLARMLNAFYAASYSAAPFSLDEAEVDRLWQQVPSPALRDSNLANVLTFRTKMRSLGHDETQGDTFYALSADEAQLLSEVEHNRWSVERLMAGFRPPTPAEHEAIRLNIEAHISARTAGKPTPEVDLKRQMKNERRIHFDLCPYRHLGVDATGRDVRSYDTDLTACIPLLMHRWSSLL